MTNARPHPGPLSQERENRTQSPERTNDLLDGARFETKDRETATAIAAKEILDRHDGFPLSRGERAGVRASVYSNFSPVSFVIAVTVLLCATMRGQTKFADAETASVPATASGSTRNLFALPKFKDRGAYEKDLLPPTDLKLTLTGATKPARVILTRDGSELKHEYSGSTLTIQLPAAKRSQLVEVVQVDLASNLSQK